MRETEFLKLFSNVALFLFFRISTCHGSLKSPTQNPFTFNRSLKCIEQKCSLRSEVHLVIKSRETLNFVFLQA